MSRPHRTRTREGLCLTVDVAGNPDAPAVVLLHGGGQTRFSWTGLASALVETGYRVLSYDARGHGESEWSTEGRYDVEDYARDLEDVLDSFVSADAPVAAIGASLGGLAALIVASRRDSMAALVLVDVVPTPSHRGRARIYEFMGRHAAGFGSTEEAAEAVRAYKAGQSDDAATPSRAPPVGKAEGRVNRVLRTGEDGKYYWHWDPAILDWTGERPQTRLFHSVHAAAAQVNAPVLLLRGEYSDVVDDSGVEELRRLLPRKPGLDVVTIGSVGHMVASDENGAFASAASRFVMKHFRSDRI